MEVWIGGGVREKAMTMKYDSRKQMHSVILVAVVTGALVAVEVKQTVLLPWDC